MPTEPTPAPYAGAANGSGPATAAEPRHVTPWTGEPGTVGTVAVVGMGKIGLPLAAQYAERGWHVIGVDVIPDVVATLNEGRIHFDEEPGLAEKIAAAHAAGRFTATAVHREAVSVADVVVMIVPLMLSDEQEPDYRIMDRATAAIGEGLRPGTLVLYETTLPVGDTRKRFGPGLERASGLHAGDAETGFLLGFSPERVFSGRDLPRSRDLSEARRRHRRGLRCASGGVLRLRAARVGRGLAALQQPRPPSSRSSPRPPIGT